MTEVEKTEVVRQGRATLRQLTAGLLDGPADLRDACRTFLVHAGSALQELPLTTLSTLQPNEQMRPSYPKKKAKKRRVKARRRQLGTKTPGQRFGLPEDFVPRSQRYGRSVLLEDNFYRLPDGQEFIPCHPTGTLGTSRHLYSLLTAKQHKQQHRGSVYVRMDGRIFDYSFDHGDPEREIFDTGYTIYDLERTGRYAQQKPQDGKKQTGHTAKGKAASTTVSAVRV